MSESLGIVSLSNGNYGVKQTRQLARCISIGILVHIDHTWSLCGCGCGCMYMYVHVCTCAGECVCGCGCM